MRKILAMAPELRLQTIQQRQRALVRRVPAGKSRRSRRYNWTADLDRRLHESYEEAGLGVAVAEVEEMTRWPRAVIYRRCYKLGIPRERDHKQRRWSAVDWKYTLDRLNHVPIAVIAKALHRSVRSVRRKVETQGYTIRMEDDYTVSRLARELHTRPQTIRQWIQEGKLKRGRNRRIKESVIRQFLKEYGHLFDPALLEPDMQLLLLECRSKEEKLSAAAS
ncbi:MAG: helix-turn-helix domain-containing protein [Candidatus Acidiferrales bacterium]